MTFDGINGNCSLKFVDWNKKNALCTAGNNYHCLLNDLGTYGEICAPSTWIQPNLCPVYNTKVQQIDERLCKYEYGKCPLTAYLSDKVYQYSACFHDDNTATDSSTTLKSTTKAESDPGLPPWAVAIFILLPLVILALFITLLVRRYRRQIKKRVNLDDEEPMLPDEKDPEPEIQKHEEDNTFYDGIDAVAEGWKKLTQYGVVILVGVTGAGKSKCGLELLSMVRMVKTVGRMYKCHILRNFDYFEKFASSKVHYCLFLDDCLDRWSYSGYGPSIDNDIIRLENVFTNYIRGGSAQVLLTVNVHTWNRFAKIFKGRNFFRAEHIIRVDTLSYKTKMEVLKKHLSSIDEGALEERMDNEQRHGLNKKDTKYHLVSEHVNESLKQEKESNEKQDRKNREGVQGQKNCEDGEHKKSSESGQGKKNSGDGQDKKKSGDEQDKKKSGDEHDKKNSGDEQGKKKSGDEQDKKNRGDEQDKKNSGDEQDKKKSGDEQDKKKSGDEQDKKKSGDKQDKKKSGDEQDKKNSGDEQDKKKSGDGQDKKKSGDEQDKKKSGDEQDKKKSGDKQYKKKSGDELDKKNSGDVQGKKKSGDEQDKQNIGDEQGNKNKTRETSDSAMGRSPVNDESREIQGGETKHAGNDNGGGKDNNPQKLKVNTSEKWQGDTPTSNPSTTTVASNTQQSNRQSPRDLKGDTDACSSGKIKKSTSPHIKAGEDTQEKNINEEAKEDGVHSIGCNSKLVKQSGKGGPTQVPTEENKRERYRVDGKMMERIAKEPWKENHEKESQPKETFYLGFPEACALYSRDDKILEKGEEFFKDPINCLLKRFSEWQISKEIKEREKYVTLVYMLMNGGYMDIRSIKGELLNIAKSFCKDVDEINEDAVKEGVAVLLRSYCVEKSPGCFKFQHEVIEYTLLFVAVSKHPKKTFENCDLNVLKRYMITKKPEGELKVTVDSEFFELLAHRFVMSTVSLENHRCMEDEIFKGKYKTHPGIAV